jgi:hypothetical protein
VTRALAAMALIAFALASGCAGGGSTRARWVKLDGAPADEAEIQAAGQRCEKKVPRYSQSRARWASVEWGVAMVDCLKAEGYVLAPEEDGPLGGDE